MRSSFFLYLIYRLLKLITQIGLWLFYPRTHVAGREHLRLNGPTLLISNHPNTLIDALQSASRVDEQIFFLANAGLFRKPFQRWFFETFYCIPIERPQDTNGEPVDNTAAFDRCNAHLRGGGNLFIAPEGTSLLERHLRPLKTGLARIGLTAEQTTGPAPGIRILPLGLNYEQAERFNSRLFVNAGAPILVSEWVDHYEKENFEAVRALTNLVEDRMRALVIDTRNEEEDKLVRQLEEMLRNRRPLDPEAHFHRTKRLIEALRRHQQHQPDAYRVFCEDVASYFRQLADRKLTDQALEDAMTLGQGAKSAQWAGLLFGFPVFLYGLVNNSLPYFLVRRLVRLLQQRAELYIGYVATAKLLLGMLAFPLFYALQAFLVAQWLGGPAAWGYLATLLPSGYVAHWYRPLAQRAAARRRLQRLARQAATLAERRRHIWGQVEAYLSR